MTSVDLKAHEFCGRLSSALELMLDPDAFTVKYARQTAREALTEYREWRETTRPDELLDQDNALADLEDYRRAETEPA